MQIKGMKERYRPRKIGSIRLGIKVPRVDKKGNPVMDQKTGEQATLPEATDYFVVPDEVQAHYGPTPKQLPIFFLEDRDQDIFPNALVLYAGNGKVRCMGDGERVMYRSYYDRKAQESMTLIYGQVAQWEKIEANGLGKVWESDKGYGTLERAGNTIRCLHHDCPRFCNWGCRPTGWFRFSIQKIIRQGYWQMVVHLNPMEELISQLRHGRHIIEQYCGRATVMHADWLLTLTGPEKMGIDTKKGRIVRDVYTPRLELDPAWMERAMEDRVRLPHVPQVTTEDVYGPPMAIEEPAMDKELLEALPFEPHEDEDEEEVTAG